MGSNNSSEFLKTFGASLKSIREEKGLSLRQLAALCDIDHSDISKMEKGDINVTLLTLFELSKGLEVHPKQLIDFD